MPRPSLIAKRQSSSDLVGNIVGSVTNPAAGTGNSLTGSGNGNGAGNANANSAGNNNGNGNTAGTGNIIGNGNMFSSNTKRQNPTTLMGGLGGTVGSITNPIVASGNSLTGSATANGAGNAVCLTLSLPASPLPSVPLEHLSERKKTRLTCPDSRAPTPSETTTAMAMQRGRETRLLTTMRLL
jgi:type IV secretory pathway TrbL component